MAMTEMKCRVLVVCVSKGYCFEKSVASGLRQKGTLMTDASTERSGGKATHLSHLDCCDGKAVCLALCFPRLARSVRACQFPCVQHWCVRRTSRIPRRDSVLLVIPSDWTPHSVEAFVQGQ